MTEWENITGAAPSSRDMLRKRYPKLKAALSVVKTEDIPLLMQAKSDADERIDKQIAMLERKRWETVAEIIKQLGGDEYPVSVLPLSPHSLEHITDGRVIRAALARRPGSSRALLALLNPRLLPLSLLLTRT